MDATQVDPPTTESERGPLLTVARRIGAAMAAGMLCGLVVGGLGGRVAMFVLRVTSSSRVNGITSDDGFRIGQISFATLFLLFFTTLLGAMGGLLYLLLRQWVPLRWRPAVTGVLYGVVVAAAIIKPDGVDFSLLSPLWLAVVLFTIIPTTFGVAVSLAVERVLAREAREGLSWLVFLPLLFLLVGGPFAVGLLLVLSLLWLLGHRVPMIGRTWGSPAVAWLGRAGIVVLVVVNAVALTRDVTAIL